MHSSGENYLESVMAAETEATVGNTTINYEVASTAVETAVLVGGCGGGCSGSAARC